MAITKKLLAHLYHKVETKKNKIVLKSLLTEETVTLPIVTSSKNIRSYYILTEEKNYAPLNFCSKFMKAYKIESFFLKELGQEAYEKLHDILPDLIIDNINKIDFFKPKVDLPEQLFLLTLEACKKYYQLKTENLDFVFQFLSKDPYAINFINEIAKENPLIKNGYQYVAYRASDCKNKKQVVGNITQAFANNEKSNKYNINYKFLRPQKT